MSYFSSRMLRYATNASSSNQYADYGEVVAVITDKLININMGGSGYILEAVTVSNGYIPKIGDWVTVNWNNGNPVANGSGIGGGLQQPNTPTIISTSDLANNTINSDHIQANSIETTHLQAGSVQANQISANSVYSYHITSEAIGTTQLSANSITSDKIQANSINAQAIQAGAVTATAISANSITSVAIQANAIQVQHISANAVQTNQISANSINASKIQANSINATHISANSVTASAISANSITSVAISANAVQAQHISANSVQTQHISANSITAGMIQANQIGANHITANAIGANQITANAITSVKISANSIQSQHISANSIQAQHISAGAVTATSISANSIYGYHITASQVSANHISAQSITSQAISANAIQGQHISANSITGNHIVAGTIQTSHISANSITAGLVQANAIGANHITANAIGANHITANAITAVAISANSIQTRHISANSIVASQISANQINASHISANSIQSQHISANSIQAQHISANSITGDKIQANQISGSHIVAGTINTDHLAVGTVQQGLLGQYYTYTANATNKFGTLKGSQIDQTINFSWGTGSPSLVGQADTFAVRWQGYISAPETGTYQFISTADDGTKLVINNTTIINNWINNGGTPVTGNIAMTQGNYYPIVFEYFENTGSATVKLEWIKPSLAREVVPAKYLSQGNTVIDGAQITTGTITAISMQVGTITAQSGILADASITTATIKDGTITSAKIGSAEIKSVNIASGNITNIHIANATIDYTKINSVDATTITVGKLNGQIISGGTITGDLISGGTITGDKIQANSIDSLQIKSGAITTTELSAGSITSDKIQAGAVTSDTIRAGSITAEHISTVGLDAKIMSVYNSETGETLIGGGYLRVDGLDAGVVQSDNLLQNGLFLASSFDYGFKRANPSGEALLGNTQTGIGSHQVWKIDLVSGTVVKKIDIPAKKPVDVAIHPSGNFAYITVQGDNTMVQLDLVQDVLTSDTKTMGIGPSRAKFVGEILEDHKHVFVLNNDPDDINVPDSLTVIDTPPDSVNGELYVHHKIAIGNSPYDFVVDANMITYITMASEGHVVVVDSSGHDSALWKVKGVIPITAYGTDNLHGGLDSMFGLNEVTGGDASNQYNDNSMSDSAMSGMGGMSHSDSGYGSSDGSLKQYTPQGIEQSTDSDTLYVIDSANGELVVVDKYGNAPYNALTGRDSSSISPIGDGTEAYGGGPKTTYVRYRIPVGDTPNFVKLINGKLFISMTGSNDIVVIDEQQILNEINADRTYYGKPLGEDIYENWNPFMPMRTVATFTKRVMNNVGSKPSYMNVVGGNLYVTLGGQNQIIKINPTTETVSMTINVGTNPKGFDFTPDGRYMYVANFGGSGDLSFIYPTGSYVGDPFMGLEGGILYQGADGWTPDRSDWTYDSSGNIKSKSTVEFHINEPLLNEGGYAKLTAYGTDYQYSQLEQDITNVTNYSNGNNVIDTVAERLIPDFSGNIWTPRAGEWLNSPAPHNIMICTQVSGSEIRTTAPSNKYTIYYGSYSRLVFSANAIPSGGWIEADYRAKNNIYFKTHNSSMLVAIDNGSSPNFNVSYQVDEFVPKFVAIDNQVTSPFTPTADGISEQYNGLEYSTITNRASGMTVTTSVAPTSGSASLITNNFEPDELDGNTTLSPVPSSNGSITMPSGNQWVKIDLGAVYMVGKISVAHSYGLDRTYHKTKTEVSEDGVSWYTVYDSVVSGEYNEKPFYHAMHDHTHYAHFFTFGARPVRYVRDWANGWVSGDGLTSGSTSNWTEIKAYGDWQIEKGYTYPTNSPKAGQQIATNGYGFVSTDISKAYVAMNIQIEFTSWWYMTYIVGPQFGKIKIEMPTLMNSGHYLNQEAPFVNNVAHRHIMSFPPSQNIMADMMNNIEAGKHRVVIRQESGKVTLDRLRFEDFQYYNRSSLLIPTSTSATLFTRYKVISEQAKWYQGQGKQSTEGAYDTVRVNPDTGQPDYSVPIKYRVRLLTELNANGSVEERGTAYITSAIFETGKLSSHWRRSESSDMMPAHMIEHWNGSQPHNTGIQHDHLANGAVRSEKILPNAVYDYHISNYARISEHKLDLNHPTHPHGYYTVSAGAGPLGTDLYIWNDTLDFLNSMTDWAGISGNYGTGSTVARGDHKHDNLYLTLTGGNLTNTLNTKAVYTSLESHFANGVYADPANGTAYGLKVSQGIATDKLNVSGNLTVTGNITVTGTVDGVDVSNLNSSFSTVSGNVTNHIGSGGSAHAIAISGGANGFIDGTNYGKLLRIQDNAINQTTADGRYYIKNQNLTIVADNTVIGTDTGAVRMGLYKKAGQGPALAVTSGNTFNLFEMNTADLTSNISGTTIMNTLLSVNSSSFTYKGNAVIHSGNFNTSTLNGHAGSGGSAHAVAISGGANGFIDGVNYGKLLRIQDNSINQATADGRYLQITGGNITGTLNTKDITLTGTIDGVDISALNSSFSTVSANVANHIGSGNTAHPLAVSGGVAGFIDGASYAKLLNIQDNATNQTTSDARYLQLTGGALSGGFYASGNVNVTGNIRYHWYS
jgi:YVTN family beta-propeller protein